MDANGTSTFVLRFFLHLSPGPGMLDVFIRIKLWVTGVASVLPGYHNKWSRHVTIMGVMVPSFGTTQRAEL